MARTIEKFHSVSIAEVTRGYLQGEILFTVQCCYRYKILDRNESHFYKYYVNNITFVFKKKKKKKSELKPRDIFVHEKGVLL